MYLLDTNVLSEMRKVKQGRANSNLTKWLSMVDRDDLYVNVVVLMEIRKGILRMARKDKLQANDLQLWYESIKHSFDGRILTIDENIADICASVHVPDQSPANDAWIASTAIAHDLTLVTRNVADFDIKGLQLFNPFDD